MLLVGATAFASCDRKTPTEPDCTATLTPTSFSFQSASGAGSIALGIGAGCEWSAQAQASWITITGGLSGDGPGTVAFSVAENAAEAARTGTLTIASLTATVAQEGREPEPECTYTLSPEDAFFSDAGGTGDVTVAAPAGCPWTASSDAVWLTILTGASGSGTGVVGYVVDRNREAADRLAVLTVADRQVTVTQAPDLDACVYEVEPVAVEVCMPATERTTQITTQDVCPWTARSDDSWIEVTSGRSGTGSRTVRFRIDENYDAARLGLVMVRWPAPTAGQNVRVAQAGCRYSVVPGAFNVASAGGSFRFDVLQQSDPTSCGGPLQDACVWSAVSDVPWIVVTSPMLRSGDNPVQFSVQPNSGAARTGTIRVRDQTVTISQAGT